MLRQYWVAMVQLHISLKLNQLLVQMAPILLLSQLGLMMMEG